LLSLRLLVTKGNASTRSTREKKDKERGKRGDNYPEYVDGRMGNSGTGANSNSNRVVVTGVCYITVDFATAASQNGVGITQQM
jgi:hypothetical protein